MSDTAELLAKFWGMGDAEVRPLRSPEPAS